MFDIKIISDLTNAYVLPETQANDDMVVRHRSPDGWNFVEPGGLDEKSVLGQGEHCLQEFHSETGLDESHETHKKTREAGTFHRLVTLKKNERREPHRGTVRGFQSAHRL